MCRPLGLEGPDLVWLAVDLGRVRLTRDHLTSADAVRKHGRVLGHLTESETRELYEVAWGMLRLEAYGVLPGRLS